MHLRHVVAATDQSDAGHHAAIMAARIASRAGARLSVVTVKPVVQAGPAAGRWSSNAEHLALHGDLARGLEPSFRREAPSLAPAFAALAGVPGIEIPRFAEDAEADLLVLGHKRRTRQQRIILGDIADAVARRSRIPCLFVAPGAERLDPLLVCLDATERSAAVLQAASDFAQAAGLSLRAVTVEPVWLNEPADLAAALPAAGTLRLNRTLDRSTLPVDLLVRRGSVVTEVLAARVETGAGVLAFGYHRGGPPAIVEGGSVARSLLHTAICTILTVPL